MSRQAAIGGRWARIPGWPYEVSDDGRVRRALDAEARQGTFPGRELLPWWGGGNQEDGGQGSKPYLYVTLSDRGRRRHELVHRLVLAAHVGPPPEGAHGDHIDGDVTHNDVANLEWVSAGENIERRDERLGWGPAPGVPPLPDDLPF